jgi:regulator of PEP synthase PpsR (kinase-PPPase family)
MTGPPRFATYFHVHLVSDSTGETLNAMAKAVAARFEDVLPIEHMYALVRSQRQLERVLKEIESAPGLVLHTIVDKDLRAGLEEGCRALEQPCVAALDSLVAVFARYLGASITTRIGAQHALDSDYFTRMEALDYAIAHDDAQAAYELEDADVVLVGVSRTSKTPTCIYLAHRGVKAANIPLVPGSEPPAHLFSLRRPLVVGLTVAPERLIQIRRNRLTGLKETRDTSYVDEMAVRDETIRARRMFEKHGWPVIDVTRRSVEETAAAVINHLSVARGQRPGFVP